ncbi:NAD(+) synthase [Mesonia sp. K7]|uniref:NAD(+) synthase n=1 Tax=Mesonia sp. K7 TaxID=2218606 RepID=UPI000DA83627|nr:NAD(+) synthase [Mesonia sp. K7]PZD78003.1 NAD(+) synthase [Mesonia sp. K7]
MQTEKVVQHITNWLKNYVEKSKTKGFVVGISGGIDSAVTSTLCARTGLPTLCVELPIHQAKSQVNRAQEHIDWLMENYDNVLNEDLDLTNAFESIKASLPVAKNEDSYQLSLANTRARLRMTTLYYLAGINGFLVCGTGNKVEDFGVGFFTKYGDGGVDLSPIADLMKSEVYAVAEYLGVVSSIQKAAPTDGLFGDSRTDEDQIGASYDELEWAMKIVAQGKILDDFSGRQAEVFKIYQQRHRANLHKMIPIPVCEIPEEWK